MSIESKDPALAILQDGKLALQGEFMWGSNYTFLLEVEHPDGNVKAVYKPNRGVRPLWDFASPTLARREVAAYLVSEALGWYQVPPTIYRKDGPLGPGSVQLYIEHDPEYHYFNFSEEDRQRLRPAALFDLLINNADRKGSHLLVDPNRRIWLIDHGICFHVEDKLRTIIWDFGGEPLPEVLCSDLTRFRLQLADQSENGHLSKSMSKYLSNGEINALGRRAELLTRAGRFPNPDSNRRPYPWPPV
jgi:uncharacterized repeat protein (TIGR03843 family)